VFEEFWSKGYNAFDIKTSMKESITEEQVKASINNNDLQDHYNFLFKK
jgi:hypothetical protein